MRADDEQGRLTVVTTSWDDGHACDIRVAEILVRYGILATFYLPISRKDCRLSAPMAHELRRLKMEIGSHAVSHNPLTDLSQAEVRYELRESKTRLEQVLGEPVESFCRGGGGNTLGRVQRMGRPEWRADGFQQTTDQQQKQNRATSAS